MLQWLEILLYRNISCLTFFGQCFKSRFTSLYRLFSNPADSAGTPSVLDLPVCDNHPAEFTHRHGHLQAQVHRAALQAVCLKGQISNGYATCKKKIIIIIIKSCHCLFFSDCCPLSSHLCVPWFCLAQITSIMQYMDPVCWLVSHKWFTAHVNFMGR